MVLVIKFTLLRIEFLLTEGRGGVGVVSGEGWVEGGGELVLVQGGLDRGHLSQLLTLTFRKVIVHNVSTIYTERIL